MICLRRSQIYFSRAVIKLTAANGCEGGGSVGVISTNAKPAISDLEANISVGVIVLKNIFAHFEDATLRIYLLKTVKRETIEMSTHDAADVIFNQM